MKRLLFLGLLILGACLAVWAQPYLRIPSADAHWKLENSEFNSAPVDQWAFILETTGDVGYMGYSTTRFTVTNAYQCQGSYPNFFPLQRYVHQDSNGRAYEVDQTGQLRALHDMSLSVGDSMITQDDRGVPLEYGVDSVDTVTFADNIPRKRIYLTCLQLGGDPSVWIEGIGDVNRGPFPFFEFERNIFFVCYGEYGQTLLQKYTRFCAAPGDCYTLVGTPEPSATFTLAPQPARDRLKLTAANVHLQHVRLLALDGRVVGTWDLNGGGALILELPASPAGLYLMELHDLGGRRHVQRVLIE